MTYAFSTLPGRYAVAQLKADAGVPAAVLAAQPFVSITRSADELSIVCPEAMAPADARVEHGWVVLRLDGPFTFDQVGVMASFASPLAAAGISILPISTFATDYLLVRDTDLTRALEVLAAAGHQHHGP